MGALIIPSRVALGALIIKERLGLTDRETVQTIRENPFLQYFIGEAEFSQELPFDASSMVDFQKRFGEADNASESSEASPAQTQELPVATEGLPANRGRLLSDATCAPADIRYPTDVSLLNEAREKTDSLIDQLHQPLIGKKPRPRTYRRKGRKAFLSFTKRKKPGRKKIRAAIRKQLGFLGRNLKAIDQLLENPDALPVQRLDNVWFKHLLVCREVYRQQLEMFTTKTQRIDDRIVSISQPHVRPIKRGKTGRDTEFGAKLTIGMIDGFSFVDRLSWDNYNESLGLPEQLEAYRMRFGFYPESVHVDQIYRTRANRALCKSLGIRMSGPPLGRPPKDVSPEDQKQARADEVIRNEVEGKFGEGKRRYGLGRVMTKLANTSTAQISLTFLVMNLELALRRLLAWLFSTWTGFLSATAYR